MYGCSKKKASIRGGRALLVTQGDEWQNTGKKERLTVMKMEERKSCVQEEEKAGVCVKRGQRERERGRLCACVVSVTQPQASAPDGAAQ